MSYILDALKKSEQERNAGREMPDSATETSALPTVRSALPAGKLLALAVIVAIGLVVTWRRAPSSAPAPTAQAPQVTAESPPASRPLATDELAAQLEMHRADSATPIAATTTATASIAAPIEPAPSLPPRLTPDAPVAAPSDPASVPFLRQMPDNFRHRLPPMTVNIHVYSPDEAQCMLYINNRQYRNGEIIDGGPRLERIVEDGAVLSYEGRYFKLSRPN